MTKVTRREVLALGAAAMATTLAGRLHRAGEAAGTGGAGDGRGLARSWKCSGIQKELNGLQAKLRSYNGQVPGPTIYARPGEALRIRVQNSLTPYDSSGWTGDHNVPHELNTTNLHVHGLDVAPHLFAPLGTSDPKAADDPHHAGGELRLCVRSCPTDHPPGLYWYHPHHHGSTAVQAVSGMAGPIVVKGAIDEVPEIKAARDILLAIQDIGLFPSDTEPGIWTYEPKQNAMWQSFSGEVTIYDPQTKQAVVQPDLKGGFSTGDYAERFYLLNGEPFFQETHANSVGGKPPVPTPTQLPVQQIELAPGEVVRFRVLNGCSDNLMPIVVDGHAVHLLALDGINFGAPRTIPVYEGTTGNGQVLLAPANRAEFLIQAGEPGTYAIRELRAGPAVSLQLGQGHCGDRGGRAREEDGAAH